MLAHRDQENLAHGHQMAASSKPLNQGIKQLNPKTPGNKVPKTPFKLPLNDENNNGFGTIKGGLKTGGKINGALGKKSVMGDNFVTPMGPKTRAPLGQKTTNAKARGLQTPGLGPADNDLQKSKQKSVKPKPRASHTEAVKIDVLADSALEERDIEYMPPPVKNLPDVPDDGIHNINLSMFENGGTIRDCIQYLEYDKPDAEGITYRERNELEAKNRNDKIDAIYEAQVNRDMDMLAISCNQTIECLEEECKHVRATKQKIEDDYQKKVATLRKKDEPKAKKISTTAGPSATFSRKAAANLSMANTRPPPSRPALAPKPSRFPASIVASKKNKVAPISSDPRRHASEVRASNTTLGYTKGRAASATLRGSILPQKQDPRLERMTPERETPERTISPGLYMHRHGPPPVGSETWMKMKRRGHFEDDEPEQLEDDWSKQLEDLTFKEAEEEFVLTL